jgi:hypothetical protein
MFNRKPLNTAISMALGAMAAVTTVAQADTVFFPQVVNSDTVTTVISVVNTSGYLWNTSGAEGRALATTGSTTGSGSSRPI